MNDKVVKICNECNTCAFSAPKKLNWGHECWGYTEGGERIKECESFIDELPIADIKQAKTHEAQP